MGTLFLLSLPDWAIAHGGHQGEAVVLVSASCCIVAVFGGVAKSYSSGAHPLHLFGSAALAIFAAFFLALALFNFFQASYYMEDCLLTKPYICEQPRYRWSDVVYDFCYREQCMMSRRNQPGAFILKERECYVEFSTRWPLFIKSFGKCMVAACVIGGLVVLDAQPLTGLGAKPQDEATMVREERVKESLNPRCISAGQPSFAALGDSADG